MKAAVIVFPGSNCDRDVITTVEKVSGRKPALVWHATHDVPKDIDVIILPGGFSYGDYLRSGAIAAKSPVMREVIQFAKNGGYVIGICNGFQVLAETNLVPGTLMRNRDLRFVCRHTSLTVANTDSIYTKGYQDQKDVIIPVAHHDGNYFADEATLDQLEQNGQIAFRYQDNPNGSCHDIAGVLSENKRVLGMMPHPERAVDPDTGNIDGRTLFETLLNPC